METTTAQCVACKDKDQNFRSRHHFLYASLNGYDALKAHLVQEYGGKASEYYSQEDVELAASEYQR